MFKIDTETKAITLPQGDTLLLRVRLNGGELPEGTVGVFAVCTRGKSPQTLFSKVFPLTENALTVNLTNAETRQLPVGEQRWDIRLVSDPEYDANGGVRCDDESDSVLSIFSGSQSDLPKFCVTAVAKVI